MRYACDAADGYATVPITASSMTNHDNRFRAVGVPLMITDP
jgi:hypothetical protein